MQEKLNAVDDIQLFLLYSSILLDRRGRNIDESKECELPLYDSFHTQDLLEQYVSKLKH